jgi:cell division septum initiation protein DivIVA
MVGGAVSLIPGFGQIAGPIIAIGGNILGSLIGNGTPQPVNSYGTGALNYGSGGFGTSGGTYGANANQVGTTGALGQAGQSIQAIFNALGGVKDQSRVYGLQLQSFNQQYADGSAFNNQTSYIVGPDGSRIQWGQGSNDKDIGLSTAAGHIAAESIMGGAVGQISDNLKRALSNLSGQAAPTLDDIASLVTQVKAFDDATKDFGHTVSNATKQTSDALDQIENSFSALYDVASKYGLDTSGIDQQKALQLQKYGSDFAYSVNQSILGITDPRQASLNDLAKERQGLLDQNAVMLQRIAGYADQTVQIEEYAAEKRKQIVEQANAAMVQTMQQGLTSITDLIKQLSPGGNLANVDPTSQLAGLRATYQATRAQALAGDQGAYQRYASDASALAQFSLSYYGGNSSYTADRNQILSDALSLAGSGVTSLGTAANGNATVQQLSDQIAAMVQMQAANQADVARLTGLLSRYITNKAA